MYVLRVKKENRLFAGLWYGSQKPDMTLFLAQMCKSLAKLYTDGESIFYCNANHQWNWHACDQAVYTRHTYCTEYVATIYTRAKINPNQILFERIILYYSMTSSHHCRQIVLLHAL